VTRRPFLGINCGAIPEHLLESELFGHVRGAFTGADRDRRGLFREATGGTLLLDEIGEMPHKMQAGLLRVLQEKLVRPVGSSREEPVDTRVIAATHRDLGRMVAEGTFREDLFYRLNVISIRVPSLRERLDDIPLLIDHFLGIFAARYWARPAQRLARGALKALGLAPVAGQRAPARERLLNAWVLSDAPELEPEDFELPDPSLRPRGPERAPRRAWRRRARPRSRSTSRESASASSPRWPTCNWNRVQGRRAGRACRGARSTGV
jgi:serine/threonine-protein kinase PknK